MRPEAKHYVCRFMDAYMDGKDDLIRELHAEIRGDQELFIDVWASFPTASIRRRLKEIIRDIGSP